MTRWRWAALAGLLTLLVGISFGWVPSSAACRAIAPHPWASFQQVRTIEHARTIINACQSQRLRVGMWIDALAFIPVYGTFLLMALWAVRRGEVWGRFAFGLGLAALVTGMICDQVEGLALLRILNADPHPADTFTLLAIVGTGKTLALAVTTMIIGELIVARAGWQRIAGLIIITGGAIALTMGALNGSIAALGMLIGWLTLVLVAVANAISGSTQA